MSDVLHRAVRPSARLPLACLSALAALGAVAGCTQAKVIASTTTTTRPRPGSAADPVAPSLSSVRAGNYVTSVTVGGGVLVVSPPPKGAAPSITATDAMSLFQADASLQGTYAFDILGLGSATLDQAAEQSAYYRMASSTPVVASLTSASASVTTTTTAKPAATTTTTTKAAAPTTTTTTAPPPPPPPTTSPPTTTPTTSAPTTSTTAAPTATVPTTAPPPTLPAYDKTLAWVGIAVTQNTTCTGSTGGAGESPGFVAVLIDAYTGTNVLDVSQAGCNSTAAPTVARANELQSVPWALVGPSSTAIVAEIPACGTYVGWTGITQGLNTLIQVQASVPYDPQCASTAATSTIINLVVPTGANQSTVPHAPLGPITSLLALA